MNRKSSILKGIGISLIYAVIYWLVIVFADIVFYETYDIICLVFLIGICIIMPTLYYFIERRFCESNHLAYNVAFFVTTIVSFALEFGLMNVIVDVLYDKIHPNDTAWLAGLQYLVYYLLRIGSVILNLVIRIIILIVSKIKHKKQNV